MQEFNIGDNLKVVNIEPLSGNTIRPPLDVSKLYPILAIVKCGCGKQHLDVGLISEYNYISCHNCGEQLPTFSNERDPHWCHPSRFEKV